jgi:hypothetical protein
VCFQGIPDGDEDEDQYAGEFKKSGLGWVRKNDIMNSIPYVGPLAPTRAGPLPDDKLRPRRGTIGRYET